MSKRQTMSASLGLVFEPSVFEAQHFAAAGDEPKELPLDERRTADALQRPVVARDRWGASRSNVDRGTYRPAFVEAEQAAEIHIGRITLQPAGAVIGADPDLAISHHGIAIALRAELGDPLDVLGRVGQTSGPTSESNLPTFHSTGMFLAFGRIVSGRRAAPLRPVGGGRDRDIDDNSG